MNAGGQKGLASILEERMTREAPRAWNSWCSMHTEIRRVVLKLLFAPTSGNFDNVNLNSQLQTRTPTALLFVPKALVPLLIM